MVALNVTSSLRAARLAVIVTFFCNGVGVASWATRIPAVQQNLHLSPGLLGLALFGSPVGAVSVMPFIGALANRFGSKTVTRVASVVFCLTLPLPALTPNLLWLTFSLLLFGACAGAMDVSMNIQAVAVEHEYHRSIMSGFHASFSFGALAGAIIGVGIVTLGVAPLTHLLVISFALFIAVVVAGASLHSEDADIIHTTSMTFSLPTRPIFALAFLAFCIQFCENAIGDWGAVYLHTGLGTTQGLAALGYASFASAMAVGRLAGDRITQSIGPSRLAIMGSSFAALGLGIGLWLDQPVSTILGFLCFGAGYAVLYPLVVSASGRVANQSAGSSVAAVMTSGYTGMMAGPPLIGGIASLASLRVSLGLVVLMSALIAVLSRTIHLKGA